MTERVDLYDSTYDRFRERVLADVRAETFERDIGQNSWLEADELERFIGWLAIKSNDHVLEVASGSGGPARFLAERAHCRVTGIDANESGVATATRGAADAGASDRVSFRVVDANAPLAFDASSFDAIICVDAMNHLPDRASVLREWHRVLRRGRRALFTDPVVITGAVTNDELALRSSIGQFVFVPPGVNEELVERAGFDLVRREDVTEAAARVAERWHRARERHEADLLRIEGRDRFDGLQRFLAAVHRLSAERRLSRIVYVLEKRVD